MTDQLPGRTPPWSSGVWFSSTPPQPQPQPVRIGDVERDTALDRLGEHFAAGRLTRDELDERTEQAMAARFDRDLEPLFRDLPGGLPGVAGTEVDRRPTDVGVRRPRQRPVVAVPAVVGLLVPLLVLAVFASIFLHVPFLIGPVVWMLLLSGAGRRHHHG